ncbi:protease SohB [Agarivorans sp. MS3-6]|uniref:protease SohB n=1 Tax=Agarivorans sp. TSD2052 TaxID=2937286 RepID=UPI00200FD68A|nr:protease SohB [Agarivorans sp. TSD2052]UPW20631.1 protease SohB [Agarivorans sp. TSD2052]
MDFLIEFGLFFAKALTIVIAIIAVVVVVIAASSKTKHKSGELEVTDLSERQDDLEDKLNNNLMSKDQLKQHKKQLKQQHKQDKKNADAQAKPRVFVIDFKGSIDAKEVTSLREEVTAVLIAAGPQDEVLVRLESGGGMVHGYGLAASQLKRIKAKGIKLTISVDKVAASGGYMMACIADKIIAAPFSIVGSIGVIAQIPNFNKVLKNHDIEFEQVTAGEFKRTLTMFGENTDEARAKFKTELEETHVLFKEFVQEFRPQLDIAKVATGEHWYGTQAFGLKLVDEVSTSDDYLMSQFADKQVIQFKYHAKKKFAEKLSQAASVGVERGVMKLVQSQSWDWTK